MVCKWPFWYVVGPVHGLILGVLGLLGDLTASMLKRDAGLKDFGDLLPEHGGILDRVDSFIFAAPYSWLTCQYFIPMIKKYARARFALPTPKSQINKTNPRLNRQKNITPLVKQHCHV